MAGLIEVRDLLALEGRVEVQRISELLGMPQALVNAMLERLEAMGKAVRREEDPDSCLSGSCRRCPESNACRREVWSLR